MRNIMDFIMAALPWIGIGLFVVINIAKRNVQSKEDWNGLSLKKLSNLSLAPLACFIFVAVMEYLDGDTNSATVWGCLAIINCVFFNVNRHEDTIEELPEKKQD